MKSTGSYTIATSGYWFINMLNIQHLYTMNISYITYKYSIPQVAKCFKIYYISCLDQSFEQKFVSGKTTYLHGQYICTHIRIILCRYCILPIALDIASIDPSTQSCICNNCNMCMRGLPDTHIRMQTPKRESKYDKS